MKTLDRHNLYRRYQAQKSRCFNPNVDKYRNYGAKGISVEYSFDEFYSWFKEAEKLYVGDPKVLSIGRIDHNKNYSLDNIKLETMAENSNERNQRVGYAKKERKVLIIDYKTGTPVMIAKSITSSAKIIGDSKGHVARVLGGQRKSAKGCTFRYAEGV